MSLNPRYVILGSVAGVLIFVAWYRSRNTIEDPPIPAAYLDPGYKMFPSPRTTDAPGTIYRKDGKGQRFIVTTKLVSLMKSHESEEDFGEFTTRHVTQVSSGGLIGMLFPTQVDLGAGGQRTREVSTYVSLFGARREWTADDELAYALLSFNGCPGAGNKIDPTIQRVYANHSECPEPLAWPAHRKGSTFYVIRETIAADSMDFRFNDTTVTALGGESALKEQVAKFSGTQTPGLSWRDEKRFVLTRRFPSPRRVYYLAEQIDFVYVNYTAGQPVVEAQVKGEARDSGWTVEGGRDAELSAAPKAYNPGPEQE